METSSLKTWALTLLAFLALGACTTKKIESIVVNFSTPQETFNTWIYAAKNSDISLLVQTHTSGSQSTVEAELRNFTPEQLQTMAAEARKTKFKVEQVVYEADKAFLRIIRILGKQADEEIVTMQREGQEWRIVP
jgi:hypothetical protein